MNKLVKVIIIIVWTAVILIIANKIYQNVVTKNEKATGKSTLESGPIQEKLRETEVIELKKTKITKLAKYDITGIVIAKEYFYYGEGANKISKQDLALCWGPAVNYIDDISVLIGANDRRVEYSISGEFYEKFKEKANHYISNNHIIPINNKVSKIVEKAKKGDKIQLVGYLVFCQGDNWSWGPSSMSLTDSGDGACEIFLVESATIIK